MQDQDDSDISYTQKGTGGKLEGILAKLLRTE